MLAYDVYSMTTSGWGVAVIRRQTAALALFGVAALLWVVGDLTATAIALDAGAYEVNPYGRHLLAAYGFEGALVVKVGSTLAVAAHWAVCVLAFGAGSRSNDTAQTPLGRVLVLVHPLLLALLGLVLTANNLLVYLALV